MIMSLPHVEEGPPVPAARRILAFKVAGKSFLGIEKGGLTLTASLAEDKAKALAVAHPDAYEEIWRNGKTFMGVRVNISKLTSRELRELIEQSWRHSAPKSIVDKLEGSATPPLSQPRG